MCSYLPKSWNASQFIIKSWLDLSRKTNGVSKDVWKLANQNMPKYQIVKERDTELVPNIANIYALVHTKIEKIDTGANGTFQVLKYKKCLFRVFMCSRHRSNDWLSISLYSIVSSRFSFKLELKLGKGTKIICWNSHLSRINHVLYTRNGQWCFSYICGYHAQPGALRAWFKHLDGRIM